MKNIIVLAMHGVPPRDFPRGELAEFMNLHSRVEYSRNDKSPDETKRYEELEHKMRSWPRTRTNDPFYSASLELAEHLAKITGLEVVLGFNEFCGPSLDEAFDQAVERGAGRVVVITPMMTRGGEHAESDIPSAIRRAQARHPAVEFAYVWPFPTSRVAKFLASQMRTYL